MNTSRTLSVRFREFRERVGLSPEAAAQQMGISPASLRDIESVADELMSVYSPQQVRRFCGVLRIEPRELFAIKTEEPPISAAELVQLIRESCRARVVTLESFETAVGWDLQSSLEPPEKLLENITLDGLQWLCRELQTDWQRVILSLER